MDSLLIGVAQIANTTDINTNFSAVCAALDAFTAQDVDLVLFPECALSGFSSKISECTEEKLEPFLKQLDHWTSLHEIEIVLPTALVGKGVDQGKIFNAGFWLSAGRRKRFYKVGLTESERKFFAVPNDLTTKVFECRGFRLAVLLCFEAEHASWTYFQPATIDAVLWPGYWGWKLESGWEASQASGAPNPLFANMLEWQVPLIQANFSRNDFGDSRSSGPEGLSFVVGEKNNLEFIGAHRESACFIVELEKTESGSAVRSCRSTSALAIAAERTL